MNLVLINEKKLTELTRNIGYYCNFFKEDSNEKLLKELGPDIFIQSRIKTNDTFDEVINNGIFSDVENEFEYSKLIFENLKDLSDAQAADERLWAGLCIGPFWNYVQKRWKIQKSTNLKSSVKDHYFFGYGPRRSLIRNALSRLWWTARLTYDESSEDHYHLTKFVCSKSRYIGDLLERNFSNNPYIIKPFIMAILEIQNRYNLSTADVRKLSIYLDQIGGSFLLDCLSQDTIKKKIFEKINDMYKRNII